MPNIQSLSFTRYSITHALPSTLSDLEGDVTAAYAHFQANGHGAQVLPETFGLELEGSDLVISWVIQESPVINAVTSAPTAQ
jgi:hypothetical protein